MLCLVVMQDGVWIALVHTLSAVLARCCAGVTSEEAARPSIHPLVQAAGGAIFDVAWTHPGGEFI
jgi:hypothetical protein